MSGFDHTTWIDKQRAAGMSPGNIFADILKAAQARRENGRGDLERRQHMRAERIQGMRQSDAEVAGAPSFAELVERQKAMARG